MRLGSHFPHPNSVMNGPQIHKMYYAGSMYVKRLNGMLRVVPTGELSDVKAHFKVISWESVWFLFLLRVEGIKTGTAVR